MAQTNSSYRSMHPIKLHRIERSAHGLSALADLGAIGGCKDARRRAGALDTPLVPVSFALVRQSDRLKAAAERRQRILGLLAAGASRPEIAAQLGISSQRLWVILHDLPPADLEAAEGQGNNVACPHCGRTFRRVPQARAGAGLDPMERPARDRRIAG